MRNRETASWPPGQSEKPPRTSVVIPVKNGAATLGACLEGIFAQESAGELEVIIIDSGSTDGSMAVARRFPVRLHQIAPEEFNHGDTRNLGARIARGEFVVMTVQDAVPNNAHWLRTLAAPFADPDVAGVCGQQIVPCDPDKNPLAWFRPVSEPETRKLRFPEPGQFLKLSGTEQLSCCGWDNVTAAYQRSVLLELPFRRAGFCEDMIWARDALALGHTLVYEPRAQVRHCHAETFSFRYRRTLTQQFHEQLYFGCRRRGQALLSGWARNIYHLARRGEVPWKQKPKWMWHNLSLTFADWSARFCFSIVYRLRGEEALSQFHNRFCANAPQATPSLNRGGL